MKKLFLYITLMILATSCTKELEVAHPNTPEGTFQALWEIIDTKYCFVEEKNVDWDFVYDAYLPLVEKLSPTQTYGDSLFYIMASMLNHLKDGHVNLYSHFDVSRSTDWYKDYPVIFDEDIIYNEHYLGEYYRIAGGVHYTVLAEGKVGYIRYSNFSSSIGLMPIVLASFRNCEGLIIDVRNNGGGYISNALEMASYFFSEKKTIGYQTHKTGEGHFDYSKPLPMEVDSNLTWDKPVVVLMDRRSYSATNLFVNAMRYADDALLVGCTSGGGGGVPLSYELPNGWLVRFSSVRMTDAEGASIEDGIQPDITLTWDSTATDRDNIIDWAVNKLVKK